MEDGTVGVELSYNDEPTLLSMEQCVAMMLTKLVDITLESTGSKPGDCVISIPGYYTDAQRQAMLDACEVAQLHCLRLLHEGTAVALEYSMFKSAKGLFDAEKAQNVVFLDLGHSSFSASVASFVTGKLTIKSAAYDRALGGRDFDVVIAKKIAEAFKAKHNDDPWENPKARMKLLVAAEKAKKTLSPAGVTEARISCECLMNDIDFDMTLKLDEFVASAEPLLARLTPAIMQALAASGIAPADIATVEIVGGSTRLGFVKTRMSDILVGAGLPIDKTALNCGLFTTMNADEAVARGTAWQAALLSTRFRVKEFNVLDAVSFPIKLTWEPSADGAAAAAATDGADDAEEGEASTAASTSAVLFKKFEVTPNSKKVTFRRSEPFTVTAAYDDSAMADLPEGTKPVIRTFTVQTPADLPVDAEGGKPKIRVNVKHNLHGIVSVSSAQLMEEIKEKAAEPVVEAKEEPTAEGEAAAAEAGEGKEEAAPTPAPAAEEEPPKKKRFKKVELTVVSGQEAGMSRARVEKAVEAEVTMAHQDKVIVETNAAKNEVEAYIYAQRDAIVGDLATFTTPAEKEDQETALTAAEDWLYYGDGYDCAKSVYVEKLSDLTKKGAHAAFRQSEARNRDACVKTLKASLEEYKKWLVSSANEEKFKHITDEEKEKVRGACAAGEEWLYAQLEAQAKLDANQDPSLTTEDIGQQRRSLVDKCKSVINKPKPKPPKEEKKEPEAKEPEAAATPEAEAAPAEGKEGGEEKKDAEETPAPEAPAAAADEAAPASEEKEGDAATMSDDK
jgi:heat shock protein 4